MPMAEEMKDASRDLPNTKKEFQNSDLDMHIITNSYIYQCSSWS